MVEKGCLQSVGSFEIVPENSNCVNLMKVSREGCFFRIGNFWRTKIKTKREELWTNTLQPHPLNIFVIFS